MKKKTLPFVNKATKYKLFFSEQHNTAGALRKESIDLHDITDYVK